MEVADNKEAVYIRLFMRVSVCWITSIQDGLLDNAAVYAMICDDHVFPSLHMSYSPQKSRSCTLSRRTAVRGGRRRRSATARWRTPVIDSRPEKTCVLFRYHHSYHLVSETRVVTAFISEAFAVVACGALRMLLRM